MPPVPVSRIPFILDGFMAQTFPDAVIFFQGEKGTAPAKKIWVRTICKTGEQIGMEKGTEGYSRRVGVYLIDISAPFPNKPVDAWELADKVENAFRRECIEGIQIEEDPRSNNLGIDADSDAFSVRVTVPWWCWAAKGNSSP